MKKGENIMVEIVNEAERKINQELKDIQKDIDDFDRKAKIPSVFDMEKKRYRDIFKSWLFWIGGILISIYEIFLMLGEYEKLFISEYIGIFLASFILVFVLFFIWRVLYNLCVYFDNKRKR